MVQDAVKSMEHGVLSPVVKLSLNAIKSRRFTSLCSIWIITYLLLVTLNPHASWSSPWVDKVHSHPPQNSWANLNWQGTHGRALMVERRKMAIVLGVSVGFGTKLGISVLQEKQEDVVWGNLDTFWRWQWMWHSWEVPHSHPCSPYRL